MRHPLTIALPCLSGFAGFVVLSTNPGTLLAVIGAVLLGAALITALLVIMLRLGPSSAPDREREEHAREQYDVTGAWPDE
jgi:hypothetical protein